MCSINFREIMQKSKVYSVSQVSKLVGVSVRTLHHYDHIKLLRPARKMDNGYRYYNQSHLILLQQILIYRALDFTLEEIRSLLNAESSDLFSQLEKQKQVLNERQQSIANMINSVEVTMTNLKAKKNHEILFGDIPKEKVERWGTLEKERLGSENIEKKMAVLAQFDHEIMHKLKEESTEISDDFAKTIGQTFDNPIVQEITAKHYQLMNKISCVVHGENSQVSSEQYVAMANSVDNKEMEELCEFYGQGYAEHARGAMLYYAKKNLNAK